MSILTRIVVFVAGLASGMTPREVRMIFRTIERFDNRYRAKYHRAVSDHDAAILTDHESAFLETQQREPTDQEIDAILDTYILH